MSAVIDKEEQLSSAKILFPVKISIRWIMDESPDLSFLGRYVDKWEEGAIDCEKHSKSFERGRHLPYFVSGNHGKFDPKSWSHVSAKDKKDTIKKYGSIEKAHRAYAMHDFRRMEAYNDDKWHMTGCKVRVTHGPLTADDSLWGIESDCGDKYRRMTEKDLASAALHALEEKILARLKVE